MKRLLLVDDDNEYRSIIKTFLLAQKYAVDDAESVAEALELLGENPYDLIISDLYMEKMDGFQFAELVKKIDEEVKIIFLTGSISDQDEVKGLKLGANDYLRKGSSLEIMIQRIEMTLKQKIEKRKTDIIVDDAEELVIDKDTFKVKKSGEEVELSALEFDLLVYFVENKNIILTRVDIIKNVWHITEDQIQMSNRTVDTHVKNLRKKLNIKAILSIRSRGYKWYEK